MDFWKTVYKQNTHNIEHIAHTSMEGHHTHKNIIFTTHCTYHLDVVRGRGVAHDLLDLLVDDVDPAVDDHQRDQDSACAECIIVPIQDNVYSTQEGNWTEGLSTGAVLSRHDYYTKTKSYKHYMPLTEGIHPPVRRVVSDTSGDEGRGVADHVVEVVFRQGS